MKVSKVLLSHCGFPCHLVQDFQILLATIKKRKKYDKRKLTIKKRNRNKRKNTREITKRGRE